MSSKLEEAREAVIKEAKAWRDYFPNRSPATVALIATAIDRLRIIEAEEADPVRVFIRIARTATEAEAYDKNWLTALEAAERALGMKP